MYLAMNLQWHNYVCTLHVLAKVGGNELWPRKVELMCAYKTQ